MRAFLCLLVPAFFLVYVPREATAQHAAASSAALQDALQPQFTPPPPGTYTLPTIDTVTDHSLLNTKGERTTLFALTRENLSVLSFMYTACADVGGCPLAAAVLHQLDHLLSQRPDIARQVTLLSVSFDPERDTPARMAEVRTHLQPHTDWHFLTSATDADLRPVLADFNQPVAKLRNAQGEWGGLFRHVLKVYLLDRQHNVRNIYSTGLFSAQLVLNDIETLLLETNNSTAASKSP
jgi:cytochrome oxidase Cu insertion factor (SCO1/SenC/PrrC family)